MNQLVELKLLLPLTFQSKLEKRFERHECSALSIDGVYTEVSFNKTTSKETEYFEITAKVAKKMFSNSALSGVLSGTKVNTDFERYCCWNNGTESLFKSFE